MGSSRLLEALAEREEGTNRYGRSHRKQNKQALCPGKQPPSPSLPTAIRTVWAKSVPAPVWYPLTQQFFSSSRPGK